MLGTLKMWDPLKIGSRLNARSILRLLILAVMNYFRKKDRQVSRWREPITYRTRVRYRWPVWSESDTWADIWVRFRNCERRNDWWGQSKWWFFKKCKSSSSSKEKGRTNLDISNEQAEDTTREVDVRRTVKNIEMVACAQTYQGMVVRSSKSQKTEESRKRKKGQTVTNNKDKFESVFELVTAKWGLWQSY